MDSWYLLRCGKTTLPVRGRAVSKLADEVRERSHDATLRQAKTRQVARPGLHWTTRPSMDSAALFGVDRVDLRTAHQLDVGHGRVVAGTEAALEDAQVATGTLAVARTQFDEQLADRFLVAQARESQAAVGNAIGLGERDQRLGHAAQFLRLGQGGTDQLVLEQRGSHVLEHGFAMRAGAIEFASGFLVAHGESLYVCCYEKPAIMSGFPRESAVEAR